MNTFILAVRNVVSSFREYGVYFLTIVIGVILFYVFSSIESQGIIMELSENQAMSLLDLNTVMSYLSLFLSAVFGFLIPYANAFLVRRRKKELGIYMTLGMKKSRISYMLICETALVGLISLSLGLVTGVFLSQGIALLTAKLYGVRLKGFFFVFSVSALWKSTVYFGIAFLIAMLFNTANISRLSLVDRLYDNKKITKLCVQRPGISIVLFVASLAMLSTAYFLILSKGIAAVLSDRVFLIITIFLGIIGTFLFFYAFSGFFFKWLSKARRVCFKGLNPFTMGQLNSKMKTSHLSMSFACLMLFLSISSISSGSALAESIQECYGQSEARTSAAVIYVTMYIGIVFMVACASILSIGQLSEISDNQSHYLLLSKLGANEKLLTGSLFMQIAFCFALPLLLAVVHSAVAVKAMCNAFMVVGKIDIWAVSLISGRAIMTLYGGYFLITFFSARKIILQR